VEAARLRSIFLNYFADRGHTVVPSASLIPHDPGLLFTIAGMVPFKPYFVGDEVAPFSRATSVQKCFRAPDIDIIGTTARHLTFFEMLGNFSFGDYFKEDAIRYAWGLITEGFGLDPDRLWVTVHVSDNDATEIWREVAGVPAERIQRLDEDNFWGMGESGPCGPCSEIFYDKGAQYGADGGPAFGGDDRFVEFWNLVFMQYNKDLLGTLTELPRKNIDTGSGFERVLAILNGEDSVFATDLFAPLIAAAERSVGRSLGHDEASDVAIRRIAEHGRAMTMLVSDGVLPSNEGRGYVLRRIIRRAILAARRAGSERLITGDLVAATIEKMGEAYPVLVKDRELIAAVLDREEQGFGRTLRTGMTLLTQEAEAVRTAGESSFPGDAAFRLHDTHGFPLELTAEVLGEQGLTVDRAGFEVAMSLQRERARAAMKSAKPADDALYRAILDEQGTTLFVGRDPQSYTHATSVIAVHSGENGEVEVFLASTPFYAESGGQVGDQGVIATETGRVEVTDTQSVVTGLVAHRGRLTGDVFPGQDAIATINGERRESTRRNHTATHLLHAALRHVLGDHVRQQGSLVAPDRLRFDFAHGEAIADEEMSAIVTMVNGDVVVNDGVDTIEASRQEADAMGAIAFFGDKYGERVRVVRAGAHSLEFCGGTHVHRLGDIGMVQVVSETSIGSGTRRLEAVTGLGAVTRTREMEATLQAVAGMLKTSSEGVVPSLERLFERQRDLEKSLAGLRSAALASRSTELAASAVDGCVVARLDGAAPDGLRELAQALQQRGLRRVVLGGVTDEGKVALAVATDGTTDATALVRQLASHVGGGGGGSPTLATAGGRTPEGLDAALASVRD
jgi:alanyl-tRNA synthetase